MTSDAIFASKPRPAPRSIARRWRIARRSAKTSKAVPRSRHGLATGVRRGRASRLARPAGKRDGGTLVEDEIYLDNNATTRPLAEVREAMLSALDEGYGNPSSDHLRGRRSRDALHAARSSVAALVGAGNSQLIFTSSATEANNLILSSVVVRAAGGPPRLVTSPVEHSSVMKVTAQSGLV